MIRVTPRASLRASGLQSRGTSPDSAGTIVIDLGGLIINMVALDSIGEGSIGKMRITAHAIHKTDFDCSGGSQMRHCEIGAHPPHC